MKLKTVLGKRHRVHPKGGPRNKSVSEALKAFWATPEGRAKMAARDAKRLADTKANPEKYSRAGIPHNHTRATVAPLLAKARQQTDRFIQKMKDEGVLPEIVIPDSDEARAEAALKEACFIALSPGEKQAKMAAIRTVLEYTRSKPESKSKVTIDTAEAWLATLAADDAGSK